eukprot:gene6614-8185_t
MGLIGFLTLNQFRRSIDRTFGKDAGVLFSIITSSQFHLLFYLSRPLPNTFAVYVVLLAYSKWVDGKMTGLISLLTIAMFVFRSEVVILAGPIALYLLVIGKLKFTRLVIVGFMTAMLSIGWSVLIDSYFWQYWLYPEGEVFRFNTIENKSSEWGTSPFHWYFSVALPKSLFVTLFFVLLGIYYERNRILEYFIPITGFIFLYSFLPHKELRFIFYSIPIYNFIASVGIARVFRNLNKSMFHKLSILAISGMIILSFFASFGYLNVSSKNYPGGYSMIKLHHSENITTENGLFYKQQQQQQISDPKYSVHIDNLAAITGVSRFNEINNYFM